jgi:small-conductance mechanosensitive channel
MIKTNEIIGKNLSEDLIIIEDIIWDAEYKNPNEQFKFTEEGFRASIKIFMANMLDKTWNLQEKNKLPQKERIKQAEEIGKALKDLVKKYTNINTLTLYKNKK